MRSGEIAGLNVTIPHKQAVVQELDAISPTAARLAAVNTIVPVAGALQGHNTDGLGFLKALDLAQIALPRARVVVLGAGGAARAVAFALAETGIEYLSIYNRSLNRAQELKEHVHATVGMSRLSAHSLSDDRSLRADLAEATLLVNTTSIGMYPKVDQTPLLSFDALHRGITVVDLIYNPGETVLIREARRRKIRAFNGLDMLIYQGLESLRLWLGEHSLSRNQRRFSLAELRQILNKALGVHDESLALSDRR
jgi:shikimate dehydrogenase